MIVEINIGREDTGKTDVKVPDKWPKVSRHHAKIIYIEGKMTFVDNESSNGSYVNGRPCARVNITEDDTVRLGGNTIEDYKVDMKVISNLIQTTVNANRTDFSQEFPNLKKAYDDYQIEVAKVKQRHAKKAQMPKYIASLIPAVIGVLILLIPGVDPTIRFAVLGVGSVASSIMAIVSLGKSDDMTEEITDLQILYQKEYKCPKCGKEIPLNMHWKRLYDLGECPHKCGAKYK